MPSVNTILVDALQAALTNAGGVVSFSEYMKLVLYHPEGGYYHRAKERVGFGPSTDFFTATSTGDVFAELIVEASVKLLGEANPADFHFVEIGAEPAGGVLPENHPFNEALLLRRGDPLNIPPRSIVFSNELFDAQPFHRLVFQHGTWREIGVAWRDGPVETLLPALSPAVQAVADHLPKVAPEDYHLDLPLAAGVLLDEIATTTSWTGLLLIFDYGKSWRELIEATPQGTARAYQRHRQSNALLANPGEQDLTCHVCWDWLEDILRARHFKQVTLQSQESFFIRQAAAAIEKIICARPETFDPRRQRLQQLLHPANMGQKFQVLHATSADGHPRFH